MQTPLLPHVINLSCIRLLSSPPCAATRRVFKEEWRAKRDEVVLKLTTPRFNPPQFLLLLVAVFTLSTASGQANYVMKNDGSGNPVNTSAVYEDGNGLLGIGTTTPSSRLDVHGACGADAVLTLTRHTVGCMSGSQGNLLVANSYHSITNTTTTRFTVTGDGKVGIGVAAPLAPLEVKINNWYTPGPSFGDNIIAFRDPDDNVIGGFLNVAEDGTSPGGAFVVVAGSDEGRVSFSVVNTYNMSIPIGILDDGTIAMGNNLLDFTPGAQLNIAENNVYDYILRVQNYDQTEEYLNVHNDGYVGIGAANSGSSLLQINSTNLPIPTAVGALLNIRDVNNTDVPQIMVDNGSYSAGSVYFIVRKNSAGIGQEPLTKGSTLALKGTSNTILDLFETSSSVDHNAQIRFIGSDGTTVRHLITEDANGNLFINAGYSTAQNKVKIDGELETTSNALINGTLTTNSNVVVNGTFTVVGSSVNQFKVGVDGKVRAREVQVDLATIPDYVFNKDYKLATIEQLQTFITTNRHLPNVPGECEYEAAGGISLGELNLKLLEKVEELSLYIIQLNERLKQLENE